MSGGRFDPAVLGLTLATLCHPILAQGEKKPLPLSWSKVTAFHQAAHAREAIRDRDRALVARIDRTWSSGDLKAVVQIFGAPSRPAWYELLTRVRSSLMDGACVRTSRILSKEVAPPYSAILLETRFRYPRPEGKPSPKPVQIHELLILEEAPKALEPIYLIETSLGTLRHQGGRLAQGKELYSGLCISPGTSFVCFACNYRLTLPSQGAWMIFARPSAESGLLESVELLSLQTDLGLDLSILPVHRTGLGPEQRTRRLQAFLDEGVRVLGSCCGKIDSRTPRKKDGFFGLPGLSQTVLIRDKRMGRCFHELHGLHGASLDYMVSVHGAMGQLEHKKRLASLGNCFEILEPQRSNDQGFEIIHRMHGGAGHFEGRHYVVDALGLDITGPDQWNRFTQVDNARFVGGFDCLRTGSVIYLSGIDRPGGHWDKKSTAAWSVSWIARQKKMHPGFRNGRLANVTISGAEGYEFDFDYPVDPEDGELRARGFLTMFPRGATLVIVMRVAHPVPAQEQILETLKQSMVSLRFQ